MPLQVLHLTGQSDPRSCALSPQQHAFLDRLDLPEEAKVRLNFPYDDRLAPYRLSMGVDLPGIGPLAPFWRPHLEPVLNAAAGRGLVVDCRSSTYVAAWAPSGDLARRWVQVRVPGATHLAKHTRGLVARALCETPPDPRRPEALAELLASRFSTHLQGPTRPGRPWVLDVPPQGSPRLRP